MFRVKRAGLSPWLSEVFRNCATQRPAAASKPTFSTFVRTSKSNGIISRNAEPKRCASAKPASKSDKSTWKIVGGIGALCGGGLVGGALLYSYNEDFRDFANKSLPIIETFNLALGPASSDESKESGLPAVSQRTRTEQQVASVSSVDQSAISIVDLDIAKSVEEETKQAKKKQATLPAKKGTARQPPKEDHQKVGSGSVALISALDQVTVSSVDLDIASKAEKDATVVNKKEDAKDSDIKHGKADSPPEPDKPVDTSFTEQELTSMVDQTAVEVSIEQALSNLKHLGHEAMEAQKKATEAVMKHVSQLRTSLVHSEEMGSLKDVSESVLKTQKMAEVEVITARSSLVEVNEQIEKLHTLIKQAESAGAKEASSVAAAEAARVTYDLQNAAAKVQKAKAETLILAEQEKVLQETKEAFRRELEEVMPGLLTGQKEGTRKEKNGDIRSEAVLLAYAHKRVEQLKQQISKQQSEELRRLEHALKLQEMEDGRLMVQKVEQEVQRLTAEFNATLKKKETELAAEHETALRQQLRRQAAAYSDNLAEVLRIQAAELDNKYKEDLKQKIQTEREIFDTKLKGALGRLRGIEFAVESRAETEKQTKQAQEMWLACQSLSTAINDARGRPKPLMPHLTAIHDASPSDSIVTQVLVSVPEVAANRGVYSEEDLRSRFYKVRRACHRVAMVKEGNSGPWTYLLSYIQSFLVFDTFDPDKDGEMVDLDNIDTFELLTRAEYYLRQGDLELAARFISQLCGESRRLSRDWLKEARLLLETRQAANFLTAYTIAAGMAGQ